MDAQLERFLDRPFSAAGARAAGITRGTVRGLVRGGVVSPLGRGCYAGSHLPPGLATRAGALATVVHPGAVLCRRTAALLLGVDLSVPGESALPVEVLVPTGVTPPRLAGCRAYQSSVPDADVVELAGVRVTSGTRTALDLARFRPRVEAVVAVDLLAAAGRCTLQDLAAAVTRLAGRRGVRQLGEVLRLADPRSESPMETRLRLILIDGGLPTPQVQYEVYDGDGRLVARLDLAYPQRRLGIEYDGWLYRQDLDRFRYDRRRQNRLFDLGGWRLRRYVDADVLRTPAVIVRQIRQLLAG